MIDKKFLLLENAFLWIAAGVNIARIGVAAAIADGSWVWLWSTVVFAAFATMFFNVIKKNTIRIWAMEGEKAPWYKFLSPKGFAIVVFMMSLGIFLRRFTSLPNSFFAYFYTGLGTALATAGGSSFFRKRTS